MRPAPRRRSRDTARSLHGRGARHVAEVLGHARVAVDGDEQALGTEPRRDRLGMAAGAEGAVDGHLPLCGTQQLDELVEKDRRVGESHLVLSQLQARLR